MLRSLIAEGHEPPAWIADSRDMLTILNRSQIIDTPGAPELPPMLVSPGSMDYKAGRYEPPACGRPNCLQCGDEHQRVVTILNPEVSEMPLTRSGTSRSAPLNVALLFQGLVKVAPVTECTTRLDTGQGLETWLVEHHECEAQWWTWTSKAPGWYTPDGKPARVQVQEDLNEGQEAVALNVTGIPRAVGLTFTARHGCTGDSPCGARFGEEISASRLWTVYRWARLVTEEAPVVGEQAALEDRFIHLTRSTAIHSAKANVAWCSEYEDAMRGLGVAERHYRKTVADMRWNVHVELTFLLSEEDLTAITKERFGGDGHRVSRSLTWRSHVDIEVVCASSRMPGDLVTARLLREAGYEGYTTYSVTGWDEIGLVEGAIEQAVSQEEEVEVAF